MKIQITIDDAGANDLRVADLLVKYGFAETAIFYFPLMPSLCNEVKGRASLMEDEMKYIAKSFEIGSHTITHRLLTRIPLEDARTEIVDSRIMLQEKFGQPINSFAYPRGYANPDLQKIVQEAGYTDARGVTIGFIDEPENKFYTETTVHAGCDRKEYGGKTWLEYAVYMLALAVKVPTSRYTIWLHSNELDSYKNGFEQFEGLLGVLQALSKV